MNTLVLRDVQASGKWSATSDDLVAFLDALLPLADRIRMTEVSPAHFHATLLAWAKKNDWYVFHPKTAGANECVILSRYPITKSFAYRATRLQLKFGRTAPTYVISAKTKGWGWASVLHTPAHNGGLRTDGKYAWPTKVYHGVLAGMHRIMLKLGVRQTWSFDANLDLRMDKNRKVIEDALPGLTICDPVDQAPTEGNRDIDGFATNLDFEPARTLVLKGIKKIFDHKPVLVRLRKTPVSKILKKRVRK